MGSQKCDHISAARRRGEGGCRGGRPALPPPSPSYIMGVLNPRVFDTVIQNIDKKSDDKKRSHVIDKKVMTKSDDKKRSQKM